MLWGFLFISSAIMKLIINRENNPATRSKIRREFSQQGLYQAYFMLEELISHQSGFKTSTQFLMDNLGWSTKVWEKWGKVLEERGHLFRYRETGTHNWTFVVYENPQSAIVKKEKKVEVIEIKIEESEVEIKKEKEEKLAEPKLIKEQEEKEIKTEEPKFFVPNFTPKINLII